MPKQGSMLDINLRDFYIQQQAMEVLKFPQHQRMRIHRWARKYKIPTVKLCKFLLYPRHEVNQFARTKYATRLNSETIFDVESRILKQIKYDISTKDWIPACIAERIQDEYEIERYYWFKGYPIRHQDCYGFHFYNKQDFFDYIIHGKTINEVVEERNIKQEIPKYADIIEILERIAPEYIRSNE